MTKKNWIRLHDASVCARRSCTQVLILPCGDAKYRVGGGRWLSQLERLTASVSPLFVNVIYLSNDCDCDGDVFSECAHIGGGHTAARQPLLNFSKHTKLCICDSLNYTMLSLSLSLRRLRKSCTACDHWSGLRLCECVRRPWSPSSCFVYYIFIIVMLSVTSYSWWEGGLLEWQQRKQHSPFNAVGWRAFHAAVIQ